MLRHSAGYALAARGVDSRTLQAFMGYRSIANTVIYTAVADKRVVRNIWGKWAAQRYERLQAHDLEPRT